MKFELKIKKRFPSRIFDLQFGQAKVNPELDVNCGNKLNSNLDHLVLNILDHQTEIKKDPGTSSPLNLSRFDLHSVRNMRCFTS